MVKRKILKLVVPLFGIAAIGSLSFALSKGITINNDTFSIISKDEMLASNFDSKYKISNNISDNDNKIKQEIKELTKKTTYLLLGEMGTKNESSEDYYKRHKDYLNLRYNPHIPKDDSNILGLDTKSQEYKDDLLSGISVPGMFLKLNELEVKYNSYGNIKVSKIDDEKVMGIITLPNITMKEQDSKNSGKYNRIKTDLNLYYYFKKIDSEYKLLYIYGETNDDIKEYIEANDEKRGTLSKNNDYNSKLRDVYDFSKADQITDENLKMLYNENKGKIVFLNSTYNIGSVASANGFFIGEGLIATTFNYIEKSLMKAQSIVISDSLGNVYTLEGIVTVNIENDIAILKVKEKNSKYIKYENVDTVQKEDAIITINSKTGVGLTADKGIVTSVNNNLQTSIPVTDELQGSPLFDSNGKIIGMLNSKMINSSISIATSGNVLKQYYNMFSKENYNDIKAIPFERLKEKYYIKYNDEKIVNEIPQDKLTSYSNIENANELIKLNLIKGSYKDGIISLRYKNNVSNYIDTMQFASEYRENLKTKGYNEKIISNSKYIYNNGKYQIIIMKEFDYLIIVMVKL